MKLASLTLGRLRYNSPWAQVAMVGFVCFCSVGMFSAVGGLGAGGTEDVQLSDTANAVLYACFAIMGFFAGSVNNILGPRLTLSLGASGYSLYIGALWSFQVHGTRWFLILAGALLGISALLWSAQGSIMMSYPSEKDKGRAFSLFWTIFNLGNLTGAAIALGIEYDSTLPAVSTGVYIAFLVITLTAIGTSWLILPPHLVIRNDGTLVELASAVTPKEEFKAFIALFKDWRVLAFFPMAFSSNYFYSYQGSIETFLFDGRTRALIALLTGIGAILGSIIVGLALDNFPGNRRKRALLSCGLVTLLILAIWIGGLVFQLKFTRESTRPIWDWTQKPSVGPIILLMCYYIGDAAYQGLAYYTMSAMTNDPWKLARLAGYYKGVQSAGSAVAFAMDAVVTPYLAELLVSWLLLLVSLPLCAYIFQHTRESNYEAEHAITVEEVGIDRIEGIALPSGHHVNEGKTLEAVVVQQDMESKHGELLNPV